MITLQATRSVLYKTKCPYLVIKMSDWSGQWESTDHVMEKYFSLFGHKSVWLVRSVEKYWSRDTCTIKVRHSSQLSHSLVLERTSWLITVQKSLQPVTCYQIRREVKAWSIILWMIIRRPGIPHSTRRERSPTRKRRRPRNSKRNQVNSFNSNPQSLWKPFIEHWEVKSKR